MNGWPTISTCLPTSERGDALGDPALLRPGHEVVDQDADAALRAGPEVAQVVGEVVDAAEELDDHALDPQVVAPDLLDELGVVPALDEDPAGAGHAGLRAVDGDGAARRPGRRRRAPRRDGGTSDDRACPRAGSPGRAGRCAAWPRRSSRVTRVEVAVDGDDLAAPVGDDLLDDQARSRRGTSTARPSFGARQSVARTSVP